ncbi:CHAT domain-containing protein [Gloeocapsa sp. BRSZ]
MVVINSDVQYSFKESVEPVYRQLVELLLQSQGNKPSQDNLKQARDVIESLQLAELDNFFRVACLEAKPILIDQVINRDDPTAAVIYPIILPGRLDVILKLPQQPLLYYTNDIAQDKVEIILDRLSQSLSQRNSQETLLLSQEVYKWLIRSAETDLVRSRVKTLVFVLDGSLRNIPMAVLHDGQQYLVEKYATALTPSLQLLNPQPLKRKQLKVLAAGLSEARAGFPPLRFVPRELEQVQSQVPGVELLNQQFTSASLQSKISSLPFPIVHLATHGQFSSQANQTFILTWDDRINVNQLSDLLQIADQEKRSTIELLVLSACETLTGDRRAALGLAGVSVRAGARSTLATLWRVNDEATAFFMAQFYQELANAAVTKAEALQRAQLLC